MRQIFAAVLARLQISNSRPSFGGLPVRCCGQPGCAGPCPLARYSRKAGDICRFRSVQGGIDHAGRACRSYGFSLARCISCTVAAVSADPQIRILELRDCRGTVDDSANLRLGRIIRRNDIPTTVPAHGSVRSGALELFLAGAERSADDSARFVIHAWQTEGTKDRDSRAFSSSMSDAHTRYYRDMGMIEQDAQSFYRLTTAVPSGRGFRLKASELARCANLAADT